MNQRIKVACIAMCLAVLSGCVGLGMKNSDPFMFEFEPIAYNDMGNGLDYLDKGADLLISKGYNVSRNEVFYTAITEPVSIGKHRWRRNGDKWDLTYQVGFQVIESKRGQIFWRITHKITGSRSGKEPRLFSPEDFDETESVFNGLHGDLSHALRQRA